MHRFSKQGQTMVRIDRVISEQMSVHRQRPYLTRVDGAVEPVLARRQPAPCQGRLGLLPWIPSLSSPHTQNLWISLWSSSECDLISDVISDLIWTACDYIPGRFSRTAVCLGRCALVCLGRCALVPQSLSSSVLSSISIGHPLGAKLSTNRRLAMAVSPFACGNFVLP